MTYNNSLIKTCVWIITCLSSIEKQYLIYVYKIIPSFLLFNKDPFAERNIQLPGKLHTQKYKLENYAYLGNPTEVKPFMFHALLL